MSGSRMRWWGKTLAGIVVAFTIGSTLSGAAARSDEAERTWRGRARNVILLIGDGMGEGDSEITIARNYQVGAAGELAMDTFPFTGTYTTYAVQAGTADVPDYVTDSAASGTAWATGHKTYNNAVSVDPVTKAPLTTLLELARRPAIARAT